MRNSTANTAIKLPAGNRCASGIGESRSRPVVFETPICVNSCPTAAGSRCFPSRRAKLQTDFDYVLNFQHVRIEIVAERARVASEVGVSRLDGRPHNLMVVIERAPSPWAFVGSVGRRDLVPPRKIRATAASRGNRILEPPASPPRRRKRGNLNPNVT